MNINLCIMYKNMYIYIYVNYKWRYRCEFLCLDTKNWDDYNSVDETQHPQDGLFTRFSMG